MMSKVFNFPPFWNLYRNLIGLLWGLARLKASAYMGQREHKDEQISYMLQVGFEAKMAVFEYQKQSVYGLDGAAVH
jgi:hypothetical protein